MNSKGRLAAVLIAAAFFGCGGLRQTATARALESANPKDDEVQDVA